MASATHSFDQAFILQDVARQFHDLTPAPRRDASPLGKLQSAHGLVGKNIKDAGTEWGLSAHDHTNPMRHENSKLPSIVAASATVLPLRPFMDPLGWNTHPLDA